MKISAPLLRRAVVYRAAVSSPSPLVGEGRGGGSRGCGPIAPHSRTPTPDPSPAEPRYSEGSATQQSDRSRQQPTSVGGGEQTGAGRAPFAANRAVGRVSLAVAATPRGTRCTTIREDGSLRVRFPRACSGATEAVL